MKKKIVVSALSLLLAIGLAGTFWSSSIAEAASGVWNSCPHGKVNDTYPGDCRDYIDTNSDDICDRSQSNPQLGSTPEVSVSSLPVYPAVTNTDSMDSVSAINADTGGTGKVGINDIYHFIPILAALVILYCTTWMLSSKKIMKNITHRKIWNIVLLISMIVSALLGLVRILSIDFNINILLPFNVLFWHVEASIILGIVVMFHIIWHWRYFAKMLGIANSPNPSS